MFTKELQKFHDLISPIEKALKQCQTTAAATTVQDRSLGEKSAAPASNFNDRKISFFDSATPSFKLAAGLIQLETPLAEAQKKNINLKIECWSQALLNRRLDKMHGLAPSEQALAGAGRLLHLYRQDFVIGCHHFMHRAALVAVFDAQSHQFYLRKELPSRDYSDVYVVKRPNVVGAASAAFEELPVLDAVWAYAQHDPEAVLDWPDDPACTWVQLRSLPRITSARLQPRHLALLSKLLWRDRLLDSLIAGNNPQERALTVEDILCLLLTKSVLLTHNPLQNRRKIHFPRR